ncbi:hypothetical protein HDU98_007636 [Podochytrium sp. JEL0797]|nr:hypothetical protein HDU98_007636 [Podochytrium sp. JEL0797]
MKFLTLAAIFIAAVSAHEGHHDDHAVVSAHDDHAGHDHEGHDHAAQESATGSGLVKTATSSIYQSRAKEIAAFGTVAAVSVLFL